MKEPKTVPRRDFIWLIVIFITIITAIIAMTLSGNQKAADNLNFAATIVSIVLAVIAIVYTFVDSGNQKQNVIVLNETVDSLKDQLDRVVSLSTAFEGMIVSNEQWRNEITNQIKALVESSKDTDGKIEAEKVTTALDNVNKEHQNTSFSTLMKVLDKYNAQSSMIHLDMTKARKRLRENTNIKNEEEKIEKKA